MSAYCLLVNLMLLIDFGSHHARIIQLQRAFLDLYDISMREGVREGSRLLLAVETQTKATPQIAEQW
jgi:hypothetical protein